MIIVESEDAASGMVERVRSGVPGAFTLEDVEVRGVVALAGEVGDPWPRRPIPAGPAGNGPERDRRGYGVLVE